MTIVKDVAAIFESVYEADYVTVDKISETAEGYQSKDNLEDLINTLEDEMKQAANELAFERAAELRDQIKELKKIMVFEF